jgi:hypothetical protein
MPLPRSVKITRNGVEYTNSVELVQYTLNELIRAALRDCGKLLCTRFRIAYYGAFKRKKGRVGKFTQYWVRTRQETPDLLVGIKPNAFYGMFQEIGSSKTDKLGLLSMVARENIDEMQRIQAQYLSAIESPDPQIPSEDDYEGE